MGYHHFRPTGLFTLLFLFNRLYNNYNRMALFIFFRFPALFLFSIATAMQKENALGAKKT